MSRSVAAAVWTAAALAALCLTTTRPAEAQRKPAPKPPAPAPPAPIPEPDVKPPDMLATTANGLTSEQVGRRAMSTSYVAKAAQETAEAASARSDAALVGYVPRITLSASYTRLSPFTPPSLGNTNRVTTTAPSGTLNPTPTLADTPIAFPLIFDQYALQATATVPISDYFLKIAQTYTAATQQEEAARFDALAARAKSYSDGRIAYFVWLRSRGALNIAQQTLAVAKAHLKDSEVLFAGGTVPKADVLRAQTAVASAELVLERAQNAVILAEQQVRIAMHAGADEKLEPGEALDSTPASVGKDVNTLIAEARANRAEYKSIEKNAESLRKLAAAQRAGRYPSLSAFGEVTYANPNPRRFPQTPEWFPTWALGAQLTWSPNDLFLAGDNSRDLEARAAALEAQRVAVRDGIDLEVIQAYQAVLEADVSVGTTTRQLESAAENYRVARELYNNARSTATALIDAETVLAQTRFDNINARADARVARIRLDHALGRDTKQAAAP